MKALILTNEYPPNVYGGAGVHVEYLSRELARLCEVEVRCFGDQEVSGLNPEVHGVEANSEAWSAPKQLQSVFRAVQSCVNFNTRNVDADLVHLHTWYSHMGGILAKLNYGIPLVLTVHSLEPLRPWKREQLGGGYDFTVWLEKTAIEMADAVIAVSEGTQTDVLRLFDVPEERVHIIHNGIDPIEFSPRDDLEVLKRFGVDPDQKYVLFVGRITRQKGIVHLVKAIEFMDPDYQVVLCAGAPDTPEIAAEMKREVAHAQEGRDGIIWIDEMVDLPTKVALYSHADVFCCPSVYEPFGIINLEAMACQTAVVASAIGGIPEVVVHGETGILVPMAEGAKDLFDPAIPEVFSRDLAEGINRLMADASTREAMALAGRERAVAHFSWESIAKETHSLYRQLIEG